MEDKFVIEFLLTVRKGKHVANISRMKTYNEVMATLRKYNAVNGSFDVDLSKVPLVEQGRIFDKIKSANLSFNREVSPLPDSSCGFNIESVERREGLRIEAYGTQHDSLARKITAKLVEVSYNLRVLPIDEVIVYDEEPWKNAAKVMKGTKIVGIMRHVSHDRRTGKEQIRADIKIDGERIKILTKYAANFPLLQMEIKCPPEAVERGYSYFKDLEKTFSALTSDKRLVI